jgi:hypothetical protein
VATRRAAHALVPLLLAVGTCLLGAAPVAAQACQPVRLPAPVGTIPVVTYPGLPPERTRTTFVPGPVVDDERVTVGLGPDGSPFDVEVVQRLQLSGTGDYAVRVRGPALRVEPLEDTVAPTIIRGAVVWQGFSPGSRLLAARLELDPRREALLLPLGVDLTWDGPESVGPGGRLPGAGGLGLTLTNRTAEPRDVPTGRVTSPTGVASALDALLAHARRRTLSPPPVAGRGLPVTVPGTCASGMRGLQVVAPLRVSGTVGAGGATAQLAGPGTTSGPTGGTVDGVLAGSADLSLTTPEGGTLELDLRVVPTVDDRALAPPEPHATWAAWAASDPPPAQRETALRLLVDTAAATARADDVAPYLGHHGPGPTTTEFRYVVAPAPAVEVAERPLSPRPVPIALTALAALATAAGGVLTWRRL